MVNRDRMTAGQLELVDSLSEEVNEEALFADGLEEAFFGVVLRAGAPAVAGYDQDKCISILIRQGMSYEEAWEYFSFNTLGAYVGENTPCFVRFVDGYQPYEPTDEEVERASNSSSRSITEEEALSKLNEKYENNPE